MKSSIFHINIQCLRNKMLEIDALRFQEMFLCFTEHWMLDDELLNSSLENYSLLSYFCRSKKLHGGVAIYGRKDIYKFCNPIQNICNLSQELHCEICAIDFPKLEIIVITLYRSPLGDFEIFFEIINKVYELVNETNRTVILNGDFNINFNINDFNVTNLIDISACYGIYPVIYGNTRGNSCLDNIFTNNKNLLPFISNMIISDHLGIGIAFIDKFNSPKQQNLTRPITVNGLCTLNSYVRDINWNFLDNAFDPNFTCKTFINLLHNGLDISFPEKLNKNISCNKSMVKWFNNNLDKMRSTLHFLREYSNNFPEYKKDYKDYRYKYNVAIKNAKIEANENYIKNSSNRQKAMWAIIKGTPCNSSFATEISSEQFNEFFVNIAQNILKNVPSNNVNYCNYLNTYMNNTDSDQNVFAFDEISIIETRDIIYHLKNKHCRDVYGMNTQILKCIGNNIAIPLTKLLNLCIKYSVFPESFKLSKIIPLHKKGSYNDCNNFRPIAIIPILSKIFEKALKKRIVNYFESNKLFNICQFGFRKSYSTLDAINKLITTIEDGFENKEYVGSIFCDLTKAFDCVSHDILLHKLKYYGFSHNSVLLMKSYLFNRKQSVFMENSKSSFLTSCHGVPQGSVLGPVLFLIYINDITTCSPNTQFILFADDSNILYKHSNYLNVIDCLRDTKSRLQDWFTSNRLCMNEDKTNSMYFSLLNESLVVNEQSFVNFLGIQIDPKLNWQYHIDVLAKKITSCIFLLRRLSSIVSKTVLLTAYFSFFQSRIGYALMSWGHAPMSKRIFGLQRKALRIIGGLDYREDCRQAFVEHNIMTLPSLYIYQCLIFAHSHKPSFLMHSNLHDYNTRSKDHIYINFHRLSKTQTGVNYNAPKMYNKLPTPIKDLSLPNFKIKLKQYLIKKCFYSYSEYFNNDFNDIF